MINWLKDAFKSKILISSIIAPVIMLFNPYVILVKAIGALVVIDIITGIMAARKEGQPITSKAFKAKLPVVGLFLIGLAAASVSSPLLLEFGIEAHQAGKWLCALYGVYELLSVLENLGRMGLPVAKQLTDMLKSKLPAEAKDLDKL